MGIKTNFRNSLIILFVFLVQVIYGQVKYCEQYTHYCFVVTPPGLNAALEESYVNFRLEAPKEVAWHNDAENKTIISQRKAESYVEPSPTEFQSDLILDQDNSGIIGNNFVVNFKRLRSVQSNTIRHKQPFVWAISYTNPKSSAFNATIEKHDWTGLTTLRLTQSGQTDGVLTTYDRYIIAHSTLMFIAWFVITPGSIFVARFGRNILPSSWFKIHWIAQLFVATPLVIIGFILPIVAVAGNVVFDETHQVFFYILTLGQQAETPRLEKKISD
ncbi:15019_t:CDS:2 [Entrophospora sp. SA101]|nr:15019_t:CDS:2 [Entrophospora sp. SA101]